MTTPESISTVQHVSKRFEFIIFSFERISCAGCIIKLCLLCQTLMGRST